jgi:hypothetical protein
MIIRRSGHFVSFAFCICFVSECSLKVYIKEVADSLLDFVLESLECRSALENCSVFCVCIGCLFLSRETW